MVVKPVSMLTQNGGDHGLVFSGTRYTSVKNVPRASLKSDSPERDVLGLDRSLHLQYSPDLLAKDMMLESDAMNGNEIHHPSLHSPEMLSTKGHAIMRDSRDELSSLRNRLASLRSSPDMGFNGGHHYGMDQDDGQKSKYKPNQKSEMFSVESEEHRSFQGPGKGGNDPSNRSRQRTHHGADVLMNGTLQKGDPIISRNQLLGGEKVTNGTILGPEKLASGGLRIQEKKEKASSRSRHRSQPSVEKVTTGDVQMVYERDDRSLQGLNPAVRHYPEKPSSGMRQAVYEIAERTRRTRHRNNFPSDLGGFQLSPNSEDQSNMSTSSYGSNVSNLRGPEVSFVAKGLFHERSEVNRINQRPQQSVENRDSPRGRHGSQPNGDTIRDTNGLRGHQSPKNVTGLNRDEREDAVRGPSYRSMQSSGEQSHQSQQIHRTHHSAQERDEQSSGSLPRSSRSSGFHNQQSPVKPSMRSFQSTYEREDLHSHRSHHVTGEHGSRGREPGLQRKGPQAGQTWFAATELQSNLLVEVADMQFHLHKFPLLSRSGRLNRLVFESRDTNKDHIKLHAMPGGPEAFELCAKFCYGIPVDLNPLNVATLRCAAEYLEMTDSLEDGNLVSKTEHYLSFVVLASWKDSITVLQSCERLLPWADELQIVRRCSESVAWKACTDPHGIRWSFSSNSSQPPALWDGLKQTQVAKHIPHDWWVGDVIQLNFDAFSMVMTAIKVKGMAYTLVGSAIAQYATKWVPGVEKKSRRNHEAHKNAASQQPAGAQFTGKEIVVRDAADPNSQDQHRNKGLVEGIISMLPPQQDAVSCSFLLRLLKAACLSGAEDMCKEVLERRVGMQMEQASLSDLLIPLSLPKSETLYDIDVVQRILEHFLRKDHTGATSPTSITNDKLLHVFEGLAGKPPTTPNTTKVKVAKLMDSYLAEVARDTNLPLAKFQSLAESLPDFSRATDDGLYRAIDTYLKTHPMMTEHERKKLCRVMDCQRLSLEACLHAAQNERLPLRVVVQVLFSEQVKLRNAVSGNALVRKSRDRMDSALPSSLEQSQSGSSHHIVLPRLDSSNAGGLSLQESWHSARRDIKSLKQEIERMKSKFSELEHDYTGMTQQVEKLSKSKSHSTSGWTSGWRKLSSHMKPPNIFNYSKPEADHHHKDDDSTAPTHTSTPTHDPTTPTAATAERRRSLSVNSTPSVQRWRNSIS